MIKLVKSTFYLSLGSECLKFEKKFANINLVRKRVKLIDGDIDDMDVGPEKK